MNWYIVTLEVLSFLRHPNIVSKYTISKMKRIQNHWDQKWAAEDEIVDHIVMTHNILVFAKNNSDAGVHALEIHSNRYPGQIDDETHDIDRRVVSIMVGTLKLAAQLVQPKPEWLPVLRERKTKLMLQTEGRGTVEATPDDVIEYTRKKAKEERESINASFWKGLDKGYKNQKDKLHFESILRKARDERDAKLDF